MQIFAAIMTLMLYVMAYNQVLVQKIMRRERDYVRLAIALFTDLPPVIVHFAQLIASIICGYWGEIVIQYWKKRQINFLLWNWY